METKTKKTIAIWAIVILVVLNISSLGTIWFHRYQFRQEKHRLESKDRLAIKPREKARAHHRYKGLPKFLTEKMNLNLSQQELMDSIWNHYGSQRALLEEKIHNNRRAKLDLLTQENLDSSAYRKLSSSQMELFVELDNSLLEMNIAFRAILTEPQRKVLNENFSRQARMLSRQHQGRERR